MMCNVKMETEYSSCRVPRNTVAWFGLAKVIIAAILAFGLLCQVPWLPDFDAIVHCCMSIPFGVDIIIQGMLVVAILQRTEQNLRIYKPYTVLLWWASFTAGVIYVMCYFDVLPNDLANYFYGLEDLIATYIAIIFISATIQWIMWDYLIKPSNKVLKRRNFKFILSMQSGTVSTEKQGIAAEKIDNNAVEEIIIINEKAKLTE